MEMSISATNDPETTSSVIESVAPAIRLVQRAAKKCRERSRNLNCNHFLSVGAYTKLYACSFPLLCIIFALNSGICI